MDSALPPDTAKNLIGLSREQLAEEMAAIGEKPFRVKQIWHWLYHRGVTDIAEMSTLSKAMREKLAQGYYVGRPQVARHQVSEDGTQKWLLRLEGGHLVESVHIPGEDRGALCISSQVGCTLTCTFCHTGTQKLVRNLTSREIVLQLLVARDQLGERVLALADLVGKAADELDARREGLGRPFGPCAPRALDGRVDVADAAAPQFRASGGFEGDDLAGSQAMLP